MWESGERHRSMQGEGAGCVATRTMTSAVDASTRQIPNRTAGAVASPVDGSSSSRIDSRYAVASGMGAFSLTSMAAYVLVPLLLICAFKRGRPNVMNS